MNSFLKVAGVVEKFNFGLTVLFNGLLFWCAYRRSPKEIGRYKGLLMAFAASDTYVALMQFTLSPHVVIHESTFSMSSIQINLLLRPPFQSALVSVWAASFSQAFVLLSYHFIYRAIAVSWPSRIDVFGRPWFVALLIFALCLELLLWFVACHYGFYPTEAGYQELAPLYRERQTSTIIARYKENGQLNTAALISLSYFCSVMGACMVIMTVCTVCIVHRLRSAGISKKVRRQQQQLFVTLCIQTAVPLICTYGPCGLCLALPAFGVDIAAYIFWIVSFFPFVDALIVICTVKPYRQELLRILRVRSGVMNCTSCEGARVEPPQRNSTAATSIASTPIRITKPI